MAMQKWTVQRIFQEYSLSQLNIGFPLYQHKAFSFIRDCRTAKMGAHSQHCSQGHFCGIHYNSCRHRGCPHVVKEQWLNDWSARLLNTQHHHWIFTFPHELLPLWRFNRSWFQDALFKAVSQTLKQLTNDDKHLKAKVGCILALWGRNLSEHPHIHCLISHGGLNKAGEWCNPKRKGLFPAEVVKRLFRGKFLAAIRQAIKSEQLRYSGDKEASYWVHMANKLSRVKWQVFACKPYKHGLGVAKYLARYMRGGPLHNSQILAVKNEMVKLKYHSHQSGRAERINFKVDKLEQKILTAYAVTR
ncbi:IS91 family transposase [Moritella viscosa]